MAALTEYLFEQKHVRVVADEAGDPWFVASDVCRVLEMENVSMALRVLDPDEKHVRDNTLNTIEGETGPNRCPPSFNLISEPGLYKLVARSRKPEAKRFDRWVRHDVLPQIRKTGSYSAPMTREQQVAQALVLSQDIIREKDEQIALLAPKAEAHDRISDADGSHCVTDAAKALQARPKDLFAFLAQSGWIYRRPGADHWCAYQSRILSGDLIHKVNTVLRPDGSERTTEQVRITPRGLTKLAKLLPVKAVAA